MLDPRVLTERRDDILESCRKRGVQVDLDAAIQMQERAAAAQTALNEVGRQRNEHQQSGKQKLSPEAREQHGAEGRRLKEAVAGLESDLAEARANLDEALETFPNFIHPDVPEGGEEDSRELRRVGDPTAFDFAARDHLAVAEGLDGIDF
ncbi:MAG: hypothetical protein OEP95_09410, partial [Myxococcales bacterium]|nr:hypothetical protein [Myxococcales bacterium]